MKPRKLKYSSTWWQIFRNGALLMGSHAATKKACTERYVRSQYLPGVLLVDPKGSWKHFVKTHNVKCVKVIGFWEVTK